jgi:hypothetical protein
MDSSIKYKRARVAITIAAGEAHNELMHIGHARTIVLGKAIADELGIPFHLRFDGLIPPPQPWDRGYGILDVVSLLNYLGILCDNIYWAPYTELNYGSLRDRVGIDRIEKVWTALLACGYAYGMPGSGTAHTNVSVLLDDLLYNHPSLMLRGLEFKKFEYYDEGMSCMSYASIENSLCDALGMVKYECSLPMVILGVSKMSKSKLHIVPWRTMTPLSRDRSRKFLLATAMCPDDPFSAMSEPFTLSKMSLKPYVWSWDDLAKLCRMEC